MPMSDSSGMTLGWRADRPYNSLPSIPDVDFLETKAVLKATIAARTALAHLDEAASSIPNPAVLINAIPLMEAQASSEIENIVTTTDALFRHAHDEGNADPATKEALRYRMALSTGFEYVRDRGLSVAVAGQICATIKGHHVDIRSLPGTRIGSQITGDIVYSPPEGRDVIGIKLDEWEQFIHADNDMDPVVRMAAAHYQFEAIHPFADGNGRTGRILNILMLTEAGVLRLPVLYLSRYFIRTKSDYYRLLLAVTAESAWEEWILYVLAGVQASAKETVERIHAIRNLQEDYAEKSRAVSRGSSNSELQSVIFEQPYCRISTIVERCGVSRPTATNWLDDLVRAGLLSDVKIGRDRLFINHQLLKVLSEN